MVITMHKYQSAQASCSAGRDIVHPRVSHRCADGGGGGGGGVTVYHVRRAANPQVAPELGGLAGEHQVPGEGRRQHDRAQRKLIERNLQAHHAADQGYS